MRGRCGEAIGSEAEVYCFQHLTAHPHVFDEGLLSATIVRLGTASPEVRTFIMSCLSAYCAAALGEKAFAAAVGDNAKSSVETRQL